jgi:hypothetical protein
MVLLMLSLDAEIWAAKVFPRIRFFCPREFGRYNQAGTVQEQFSIKAGQLCSVLHSATERGRSHTSSRIRRRTDH